MQTPTYRKNARIISILLGLVFLLCLVFIFLYPSLHKTGGLTAHIYQDGKQIHSIDLSLVTAPYELTVTDKNGNYNLIEIRPGSIGITDASCPDKLCVHMGFQETSLLPITCLPNNLVIRLERQESSLDGVTGNLSPSSDDLDGISY